MVKEVSAYNPDEVWNRMVNEKDLSILSSIPHTVIMTALQNNRKDFPTLASLQERIKDAADLSFGKKCKIQLILKQAFLSEKQAQSHPFLTEEEKFLVACKTGDVPYINYYYNNQDSSAYCFSDLVGVCTKETLQHLLNLNPQLTSLKDSDENFLIHYAAIHNRADLIHLLLEREPSVQGDFSLVQLQGSNHNTSLHFASAEGCIEAAVALLEQKALDQLLSADVDGNLPIHAAAYCNQAEIIRLFFERDPELRLKTGFRSYLPLHYAAAKGCIEAAKVLLEQKALDQLLSADANGNLPIHIAAFNNQVEIICLFLERDPELKLKTGFRNYLPLHYAAAKGCIEAAKVLLEQKASDQLLSADAEGNLPIHFAASNNQPEIIRLFLKRDSDQRLKTGDANYLPLHYAAEHGNIEAAKVLLEENSKTQLEARDQNNCLPLDLVNNEQGASFILASSITHGIKLVDTRDFFQKPLYRTVYKKIFLDFVKLFESPHLNLQDFNSLLNLAQWQASINHHFKEQIKNLKEQQLNHPHQTKEQLTQLKKQRDQFVFFEPIQFVGKLVVCMHEILRKIKEDVAREEGEEKGEELWHFPELLDQDFLLKQLGFMKQSEAPLRQLINCARKYEWTYDSSSASLTDLMNQLQNLISINKSKKLKDNQEIDVFGLLMEKFNVRTEADCQGLLGCSFDKFYKLGLHAAADLQQICVISDDRETWIAKVETLNLSTLQDKIAHFKELLVENNETELLSLEWVVKFELLKTYLKQNTSVAMRVFDEYEVSTLSELWGKISSTDLQYLFNLKSLIRNWDSSEEKPPKIPKRES